MSKRSGPHPLCIHIGMAAANAAGMQGYSSQFQKKYDEETLVAMVRGIQVYQSAPYQSDRPALETVWEMNGATLVRPALDQSSIDATNPPLVIIPSLVNRSYIFNLNARRSFISWMQQQGVPVYLLDWGEFSKDRALTLLQILFEIMPAALCHVAQLHGSKPDVLGYCIGGALALGGVHHISDEVGRIILLAAPWDFHHKSLELSNRVRSWSPFALSSISEKGYLPEQWMQALFASLDPDGSVHKFVKFCEMDMRSDEAKLFIDVEDWLNDNVNMPADIAKHCLQKWFAENVFVKGTWEVDGRAINLSSLENDVLVVASVNDRLVPYDSAVKVCESLPMARCDIHKRTCGHIGFIAGRNAVAEIWAPMLDWLQKK